MIEYYANNNDINDTLNVYKSIDDKTKDIKCISLLMKVIKLYFKIFNNGNYSEMISLYNNTNQNERDNLCGLMAINMKNTQFADKIVSEYININSLKCMVSLMILSL